jgi:hypothetical protein
METKALKCYLFNIIVPVLMEQFLKKGTKLVLHIIMFGVKKSYEVTFRKECNDLLVIRYLILSVTVPLQLLITAV